MASVAEFRERFLAECGEKNYGQRVGKLIRLGQQLAKTLPPDEVEQLFGSLPREDTFSALSALGLAEGAAVTSLPAQLLGHPSQAVRARAVQLLQASDAEKAFLSEESNQQLKTWLIKSCPTLPCNAAVLEHARQLFGASMAWLVLQRAPDEKLFSEWVDKLHNYNFWPRSEAPGLPRLANIYPDTILRMITLLKLHYFSWSILLPVAQKRPKELLKWCILDNNMNVLVDKKTRLLQWAWRHQHDVMVDICKAAAARSKTGWTMAKELVAIQQGITTSHACPTVRRKIHTAVAVYQSLPEEQKSVAVARDFLSLLPPVKEHGSQELVEGFWQVVADLGRGKLAAVVQEGLYRTVAQKLPPPAAVEQFFRLLKDVQPAQGEYLFVQSTLCKTTDGQHDDLMKKVFERFLQVDLPEPAPYVGMFQRLLQDAVTMDVIHTSFDLLTAKLSGAVERTVFRDVVSRMTKLDAEVTAAAKANRKGVPAPALPLPTSWLRFLPHPTGAPPYVGFLHGALQTWANDTAALKVATDRFGTALFWSALGHVLAHALGGASASSVQWAKDAVDFAALAQVVAIAPVPAPAPGTATDAAQPTGAKPVAKRASVYFTGLDAKKNDTFGRDADKRIQAYMQLVREAAKDGDVAAALDDLLPFLVTRFGGEQENVQFTVMSGLLPAFKVDLWAARVGQLRALWKVWSKARGTGAREEWFALGHGLLKHELLTWGDRMEPSETCTFAFEVAFNNMSLAHFFASVYTESAAVSQRLSDRAVEWFVRTGVPLPKKSDALLVGEDATRQPLQDFVTLLQNIAAHSGGLFQRAERSVWEMWPYMRAHWEALLGCGLSLVGAEYLLVGVVQHLVGRQADYLADPDPQSKAPLWWELVKCDSYAAAVRRVLLQIETGEIPEVQGAQMLARRCQVVQVMEWMQKKGSRQMPPADGHDWRSTLAQSWYYSPVPPVRRKRPDADVASELGVLSGLLDKRGVSRKVLWCVVHATEGVSGEASDKLLEKLIGLLDPRREGMGRCVAQQYPYLLEALADSDQVQYPLFAVQVGQETFYQSADLLTPALELWLRDTKTRDKRVSQLMAREDAHLLLFFGGSFAEHLSMLRQEYLHACMQKFQKPPEGVGLGEFYHHTERGPSLLRVAQFGKGWRNISSVHDPTVVDTKALQTFLWHRDTQALFLEKALTDTNMGTLAIIPSLLYVEGIAYAGELLQAHPREQRGTVTEEGSHWTVIQPTGTFQDVWAEVERRFLEIGPPGAKNAIGDREADQLLVNLGRADNADKALAILGRYASKFKRAKEALMLALPSLGPSHARRVIEEVCFAKEAGVSLQVAALKLLMDLQVPNPLQLYRVAWRDGVCHRDVAAIILKKVATSPLTDWSPHDVLDMFELFGPTAERKRAENAGKLVPVPEGKKYPEGTYQAMSAARKENLSYIANLMLQGLQTLQLWHLPFLPEVVGRLVLLPGSTEQALLALKACRNHTTEVVAAMTLLIQQGRLAALVNEGVTGGQQKRKGPKGEDLAQVLSRIKSLAPDANSELVHHIRMLNLKECDPATLRAFVDEMLYWQASIATWPRSPAEKSALQACLQVWVAILHTLPSGGGAQGWARTLREMEREVAARGGAEDLGTLVKVVVEHIRRTRLSRVEEGPWVIPTIRDFFERVWLALARVLGKGGRSSAGMQEVQQATAVQAQLLLTYWTELFAQGGGPEEVEELFKKCPEGQAVQMVAQVVAVVQDNSRIWWRGTRDVTEIAVNEGAAHVALRRLLADGGDDLLEELAKLWPKVLVSDTRGEVLQGVLATFGQHPESPQCIALVENLLGGADARTWRPALRWLLGIFPRDAVRLWPKVLANADPKMPHTVAQATEDVAEILKACGERGIEPPRLPVKAATIPAVLQILATSPNATARVAAVRALREMDLRDTHKEHAPLLDALRSDPHTAVAAAATLAWSNTLGEEEAEEVAAAAVPVEDVDPDAEAEEKDHGEDQGEEGEEDAEAEEGQQEEGEEGAEVWEDWSGEVWVEEQVDAEPAGAEVEAEAEVEDDVGAQEEEEAEEDHRRARGGDGRDRGRGRGGRGRGPAAAAAAPPMGRGGLFAAGRGASAFSASGPQPAQAVAFLEKTLESGPAIQWRPALRAMATISPRDAVRLWPKVLQAGQAVDDAAAAEDVKELLALCEANQLEVPALQMNARAGPLVLQALIASPLASARVAAAHALLELHTRGLLDLRVKHQQEAELLRALRADADGAVATAAQQAWESVFGEQAEVDFWG